MEVADTRSARRAIPQGSKGSEGSSDFDELRGELERQASAIADLRESVQLLLNHAGAVNVERERRLSARVRRLRSPRLTSLRQHSPRPLRVPKRYLDVEAPQPAPSISIVTPSYQQAAYLERTIRSVLAQRYPKLEYIVQDGGSSDGSRQVLERHSDALASWSSAPDGGQADAINRGFARSTGEIMAYLNSDDVLLPGALNYIASYFARHPRVDAVYGHRIIIDEDDREIGRWILPKHRDWVTATADYVPQETLFWRRRAWERAGARLDTELDFAIDWDLLLRFLGSGCRMVRVPRFLGAFRVHDGQKTLAQARVGIEEAGRLREQSRGRQISDEEVLRMLEPYFRRHKVLHYAYRLASFGTPTVEVTRVWQERLTPASSSPS
jgi:glycosyltransferase involved in cell wall biosynthesis